jgi:hypothetical protein
MIAIAYSALKPYHHNCLLLDATNADYTGECGAMLIH